MRTISFSFVDSNGDASSSSAKARERCLSFLKIDGAENGMDYRPITPPASWNAASAVIESRLRSWLTQRIKKSDLVSMLRDLCKDELRVASYYMPASIVRIPRDLALLLNILSEIEALPLVPPPAVAPTPRDGQVLAFAKNNVMVPRSFGTSGLANFGPDAAVSGYLCATTADIDGPLDDNESSNDPIDALRIVWTPNECFKDRTMDTSNSLCSEKTETPLPEGWDMAYDPITGGTYYINHAQELTTWTDPRVPIKDVALEDRKRYDSKGSSTPGSSSSIIGLCSCTPEEKMIGGFDGKVHKCSIVMDLVKNTPINCVVHRKKDDRDSGHFIFLTSEEDGTPNQRVLLLERGGISTLVRLLKRCTGCVITGDIVHDSASSIATESLSHRIALSRRRSEVESTIATNTGGIRVRRVSRGSRGPSPRSSVCLDGEVLRDSSGASVVMTEGVDPWVEVDRYIDDGEAAVSTSVTLDSFESFLDKEGRHTDWSAFRKLVFFCGLHPEARATVWPFLLGVHDPAASWEERDANFAAKTDEYHRLRDKWELQPSEISADLRSMLKDLFKDVVRTDRDSAYFAGNHNENLIKLGNILMTYCWNTPGINYSQGMSDLLSPVLMTLHDEALAYWAFVTQMEHLSQNFDDGLGMHTALSQVRVLTAHLLPSFYSFLVDNDTENMYFSYRWLLLDFKREFPQSEVLRVWEAIWCKHRTSHFQYIVAVAAMQVYGRPLMDRNVQTQNILEYFTSMSAEMDCDIVLGEARKMLYQLWEDGIRDLNESNNEHSHLPDEIRCYILGDKGISIANMIKPLPSTDGGDTSCNDDRDGHDKSGTSDENIAFQNIEAGRKSNYADGVIRYESTLRGDNSRPLIFQNDDDHLTGNFRDPELEMEAAEAASEGSIINNNDGQTLGIGSRTSVLNDSSTLVFNMRNVSDDPWIGAAAQSTTSSEQASNTSTDGMPRLDLSRTSSQTMFTATNLAVPAAAATNTNAKVSKEKYSGSTPPVIDEGLPNKLKLPIITAIDLDSSGMTESALFSYMAGIDALLDAARKPGVEPDMVKLIKRITKKLLRRAEFLKK